LKSWIEHTRGRARVIIFTAVSRAIIMVCLGGVRGYASTRCCLSIYLLIHVPEISSLPSSDLYTPFSNPHSFRWLSISLTQISSPYPLVLNPCNCDAVLLSWHNHYTVEALAPQLLPHSNEVYVTIICIHKHEG